LGDGGEDYGFFEDGIAEKINGGGGTDEDEDEEDTEPEGDLILGGGFEDDAFGDLGFGGREFGESVLEMFDEFVVALVALFGIFFEGTIDGESGGPGDPRGEGLEADGLSFQVFEGDEGSGFVFEGWSTGEGVEESGAEGIDIAPEILGFVVEFFWGEIVGCAPDFAGGEFAFFGGGGETEVDDFGDLKVIEEDIAWFDIAMDETGLVSGAEALGDLDTDLEGLGFGDFGVLGNALIESALLDEFHGDVEATIVHSGGVNLDDMGMIDGSGEGGFVGELGDLVRGSGRAFAEEFEGDEAFEGGIAGFVDHAHAAFAEDFEELEVIDMASDYVGTAAGGAKDDGEGILIGDIDEDLAMRAGLDERIWWFFHGD
jgi:hypothetical protein